MHQTSKEEFSATGAGFLEHIHPEDRDAVQATVDTVHDGADEFEWTARILRGDGSIRWLRGLGRAERDDDGTLVRVVGTDQDITEKVLADQEIREAARRLALLRQVAVVANQSTGLVETLLRTADAVGTTPGWDCAVRLPPRA